LAAAKPAAPAPTTAARLPVAMTGLTCDWLHVVERAGCCCGAGRAAKAWVLSPVLEASAIDEIKHTPPTNARADCVLSITNTGN